MKKVAYLVLVALILLVLSGCQESTSSKYERAQSLLAQNKFSEAAEAFSSLGSYEDAAKLTIYCKAADAGESGNYETAIRGFQSLENYKDSDMMIKYYLARQRESYGWEGYSSAIEAYNEIQLFRDSSERIISCQDALYAKGAELQQDKKYEQAITVYKALKGYGDSADQIKACQNSILERDYQAAKALQEAGKYEEAITAYKALKGYSDSADQIKACQKSILEKDYQAAKALQEAGKYEEAITAYKALKGYGDSADQIKACQNSILEKIYQAAKALQESGKYDEAYAVYSTILEYKDVYNIIVSDENIAAAAVRKEKLTACKTVGSIVTFGRYEQDNNIGNGQEEIEWIVLDVQDGKSLLLSRYGLDKKPYNTEYVGTTWEKCTLRKWLNGEFLQAAFTDTEQSGIMLTEVNNSKNQGYDKWSSDGGNNTQDQVFLLSYAEACEYLGASFSIFNTKKTRVAPTAFAKAQGAYTDGREKTMEGESTGWWWLRSPGEHQGRAISVGTEGSLHDRDVHNDNAVVRPALWLNLESGIF